MSTPCPPGPAWPLSCLPATRRFAATQRFDLAVVVRADVDPSSVTITADGINVTPILVPCIIANRVEVVAGGGMLRFAGIEDFDVVGTKRFDGLARKRVARHQDPHVRIVIR